MAFVQVECREKVKAGKRKEQVFKTCAPKVKVM